MSAVAETGTISVQSVGVSFTGYMVSTVNHERKCMDPSDKGRYDTKNTSTSQHPKKSNDASHLSLFAFHTPRFVAFLLLFVFRTSTARPFGSVNLDVTRRERERDPRNMYMVLKHLII